MLLSVDIAFFDRIFLGETIWQYIWFVVIILLTLLLKKPTATAISVIAGKIGAKFSYATHKSKIEEMLLKPMEGLLQIVLYFVAVNQLSTLLDNINISKLIFWGRKKAHHISLGSLIDHVFLFLFIVSLTRVVTRFIDFFYYLRMRKAEEERNLGQQQLLPLIKEMSKLLVWSTGLFCVLGGVFHVNVPALITGLGIGGVAIALAGKETVENFFAAFTLLSDKPFQTGDTIKIGDIEGAVERIGFRSTRIRNAEGAAIIVPNQNLVSQNLTNLSARHNRAIKVSINLRYGIDSNTLEQLIQEIKAALKQQKHLLEPIVVAIEQLDKETLQLVVSYNLPHPLPSGISFVTIKQEINLLVFKIANQYAKLGAGSASS